MRDQQIPKDLNVQEPLHGKLLVGYQYDGRVPLISFTIGIRRSGYKPPIKEHPRNVRNDWASSSAGRGLSNDVQCQVLIKQSQPVQVAEEIQGSMHFFKAFHFDKNSFCSFRYTFT